MYKISTVFIFIISSISITSGQHSVAREWNEVLLEAIRNDFARPTVHARNLFHFSIACYDGWAVYDEKATTYFLGKTIGEHTIAFDGVPSPPDRQAAQEEAISFAVYRLLKYRFGRSPGADVSIPIIDSLFAQLGFDPNHLSTEYSDGVPASLGNYLAAKIIEFGLQDHSNEEIDYANKHYLPVNNFLVPTKPGNEDLMNPNRWQPLSFDFFIDQAGFEVPGGVPEFLGPEWGKVTPFSLREDDLKVLSREDGTYYLYHDPGPPAYLREDGGGTTSEYIWNHSLVAIWSSQLDPSNEKMIDISPASIGNLNIEDFPKELSKLREFYNLEGGGDYGAGYDLNPYTEAPYQPQMVLKADYARVLAEFWADGPDSETPPGHWFTILNYVNDHPLLEKKFGGQGPLLNDLEWDVKAYFVMGGTLHDAAIAAWSVKGWYDYIRPISAIRFMASEGQSSDTSLANYAPHGLPLKAGLIEVVGPQDSLAGDSNQHVGKIKLFAWRGPNHIPDPSKNIGGVGWILAEDWWPYQRPTFVTPPFAGYVSGHSTFSRAAAEILTLLTGSEYFPGGMGEFYAKKDDFLVFERGPSMDITLQWAKYYDASDQCSLSRIWGGIHPPVDDIPGRLIGHRVGIQGFRFAEAYFGESTATLDPAKSVSFKVFPNPVSQDGTLSVVFKTEKSSLKHWSFINQFGQVMSSGKVEMASKELTITIDKVPVGMYFLHVSQDKGKLITKKVSVY